MSEDHAKRETDSIDVNILFEVTSSREFLFLQLYYSAYHLVVLSFSIEEVVGLKVPLKTVFYIFFTVIPFSNILFCICDVLSDFVPFVQIKKREKHP